MTRPLEWVTDRWVDARGNSGGRFERLTLEFHEESLHLFVQRQQGLGWCASLRRGDGPTFLAEITKRSRLGSAQNARAWAYNEAQTWMEKEDHKNSS